MGLRLWTTTSNHLHRTLATIGLSIALLASISVRPALGQETGLIDDSTYVFALDGTTIEWGGGWEFDPATGGQDAGIEVIGLASPLAGLLIGELQAGIPVDLNQFLALLLETVAEESDEFVTVERSETDTVSYSLDAAVVQGVPAGLFTYVQPNTATGTIIFTSILTEASIFAIGVADAQANVTVDGSVALEGIDGAALQDLLPDVVSSPAEDDQQADDDDRGILDDHVPPPFDEDDGPLPGGDEESDPAETDGDDQTEDDEGNDLTELGLVEEGRYESPQFGTEIAWSNAWTPDPELLASNEDDEVDSLGVTNEGGALVLITIFAAGGATPEDFAGFWESDDFLDENASPDAEVLLADSTTDESGVLIAETLDNGGDLWTLRQAYSLDDGETIAIVLLVGVAAEFPENLEEAQEGISIESEPAVSLFSVGDLEDAG